MLLRDARAYRDRLRATDTAATVPTGHSPYQYFVKVWPAELHGEALHLATEAECDAFLKRVARNNGAARGLEQARSPIDRLIDAAVGP